MHPHLCLQLFALIRELVGAIHKVVEGRAEGLLSGQGLNVCDLPGFPNVFGSYLFVCQPPMVAEKYMSGGSVNMSPPGAPISMYLSLGKLGGFGKVHGNHGSTELDDPPPGDPLGDKH